MEQARLGWGGGQGNRRKHWQEVEVGSSCGQKSTAEWCPCCSPQTPFVCTPPRVPAGKRAGRDALLEAGETETLRDWLRLKQWQNWGHNLGYPTFLARAVLSLILVVAEDDGKNNHTALIY